jgi:hypothetical protein
LWLPRLTLARACGSGRVMAKPENNLRVIELPVEFPNGAPVSDDTFCAIATEIKEYIYLNNYRISLNGVNVTYG